MQEVYIVCASVHSLRHQRATGHGGDRHRWPKPYKMLKLLCDTVPTDRPPTEGSNMKKRSLRVLVCSLAAVLAVTCGLVLTACGGPSDEDAIRQDLTTQLDQVKNADEAVIQELIANADTSSFEQMGVDPAEFIGAMLDGFDYSIDSVSVDGDTATASVTVTCKSMTTMQEDAMNAVYALVDDPSSLMGMSEDELMELAGQTMMDAIKGSETHQSTYEFTYAKNGDTWTMQDSVDDFMNAVFA